MSEPLVSVLMPVYNAERYVAEAVESILAQTFADFEFLIIDDGSTDGSLPILEQYARQDGRIRLVSRANTGYLAALNEMLGMARGELIARMDADDIAMPERLERQASYLRANPSCLLVGGRGLVVDPDGDPLCHWNSEQTHEEIDALHMTGDRGSVICHPTAMMRREAVLAVGKYREPFYTAEDLDLFLRLAERGRVANLPQVLLKYRMHPTSVCHTRKRSQQEAIRAAIADARVRRGFPINTSPTDELGPPAGPPQHRLKWAWWALTAGNVLTARKHAMACLVESPLSIDSWRLLYCALRGY